ncbi:MAG: HAD family hydrolase [Chloroflexi bacterium HGW-Chloroflexi-10]|nr:MAG: HAD family hydrolase [Chloroflexi bacterium HGW-Chloroflexi-10]
MKYKLVIFDFDGTLADSFPWFLTVFDELAERFNLPKMEKKHLEKLREMDINHLLREYNIPLWKMVKIGNHLKKMMSNQIEKINLINGMQQVIDSLVAQEVRLAVVSSNAEENVRQVLGAHNAVHFEQFECGVSMFGKKSKFLKVLKKTGINAQHTLCIGDELRDLVSAKQASIPFGAVSWGYSSKETLLAHAPDEWFTKPSQILQAINPLLV